VDGLANWVVRSIKNANAKRRGTMPKITKSDHDELNLAELGEISGGSRNIDNPAVRAFVVAFEKAVKEGQRELVRSLGPLGSTNQL